MHASVPRARFGLLAVAAALIAVLAAAPSAGAATIDGGDAKFDFKTFTKAKKATFKTVGANPNTKTGGTFSVGTGTVTFNEQPSGNLGIGGTSSQMQFKIGKKTMTLTAFTLKLTSGKGALNAVVNKKGKAVTLFDVASPGKIGPNSPTFTELRMSSSNMQLTKSGAASINKAFGLKGRQVVKAKQKVGTMSLIGQRSLKVSGGTSQTVYDVPFYDRLQECDITLGSVPDATPIAVDPNSAPRGGVSLPIKAGTVNASTLFGNIDHSGGTVLDRPAPGQPGNRTGRAEYRSELTDFTFDFGEGPGGTRAQVLSSFVKNLTRRSPVGDVTGTLTTQLNDTGGTLQLNGDLVLSEAAAILLSSKDPPIGADCPIPAGSKIGAVQMTANVN